MTRKNTRVAEVRLRLGFSKEDRLFIQGCASAVWGEIAPDVFECGTFGEDQCESIERAAVIELVCDADRLADRVKHARPDLAQRLGKMSYVDMIELVKPAFPYSRYSM